MSFSRVMLGTILAGFPLVASCSGGTEPVRPGPPAALRIVAGDGQTATVGTDLANPIAVNVTDASGAPVPGQVINFRVVSGGGSVFAGSAITTAAGVAQERWTLGTVAADSQRVEARAIDPATGERLVFATFRAVAVAGSAAAVKKASADSGLAVVGGVLPTPPRVRVSDRYDNPVPGVAVTYAVTSGGGSLTGGTATTDASGMAAVGGWTLGNAVGTNALTASVAGIATPVTFTATGIVGAAVRLTIVQPAGGAYPTVAFTQQPSVRIEDARGNLATEATDAVTIAVSNGAGVIGSSTVSAVGGIATFTNVGLNGPPGDYTLTYSASLGGSVRSVTQSLALTAGAGVRYVLTASTASVTVGAPVTLAAQLVDQSGASVRTGGVPVTWTRTRQGGSFSAMTTVTSADGVASVTFTPDTILAADSTTITASDPDARGGVTSFAVISGPATQLVFTAQPAAGAYLITLPAVSVGLRDRYGNMVTSSTTPISIALGNNPGGASLRGTLTSAPTRATATFRDLTVDRGAAGYTLTATAPGMTSATSSAFEVAVVGQLPIAPIGTTQIFTDHVNFESLGGLHVHDSTAYFTVGTSLYRTPTTGGMISNAGTGTGDFGSRFDGPVFGDRSSVYFATTIGAGYRNLNVYRVPASGGAIGTVYSQPPACYFHLRSVAFDTSSFFYSGAQVTGAPCGSIDTATYRIGLSDGARTRVSDRSLLFAVAQGMLFYFDGTTVQSMASNGGTPTLLVTGVGAFGSPTSPIVVGGSLFWVESSPAGSTNQSVIRSAPLTGGAALTRSGVTGFVDLLGTDGFNLYASGYASASSSFGVIVRYDPATFASTAITPTGNGASSFAFDGESVYWTLGKRVYKARK